jgi:lipoate-protein ligase A
LLHHGTLLYDFDLPMIRKYLNAPEREPAYRTGRDHDTFVANLPVDGEQLKSLIATAFAAEGAAIPEAVIERMPTLIVDRYSREDWVRRR